MIEGIAIAAFEGREPRNTFLIEGLPCATYSNNFGFLNGYVRLPETHPDLLAAHWAELSHEPRPFMFPDGITVGFTQERGYDHVDVQVNGGWTYGPDAEGWIGFDTGHAFDKWPDEFRLEMVRRYSPDYLEAIERILAIEAQYPTSTLWDRTWSEEALEDELKHAATELAQRARVAIAQAQGGA